MPDCVKEGIKRMEGGRVADVVCEGGKNGVSAGGLLK